MLRHQANDELHRRLEREKLSECKLQSKIGSKLMSDQTQKIVKVSNVIKMSRCSAHVQHLWQNVSTKQALVSFLNISNCLSFNFAPTIFDKCPTQVPGPALHDPLGHQAPTLSSLWKDFCQKNSPCQACRHLWWP